MPKQISAKISEASVTKSVTDLLDAHRIFWLRMNASTQVLSYTNKSGVTKTRVLRGHKPGTADLLALPGGLFLIDFCDTVGMQKLWQYPPLWIELKAPGKKQSPEQVDFQQDVEARGMTYLLVDSPDTLIDWLKARGL